MTKPLLIVVATFALTCPSFAQYQIQPEDSNYVQLAIEHGLDPVDYPGFVYFQKYGVPMTQQNSTFRMGPDQNGAPLFAGNPGFESGDFTSWNGGIGDNTVSSAGPLQNQQVGIFTGALNPSTNDMSARHSIMNSSVGTDPEGFFSVVPLACGAYVARLGNTYATYQGQYINQSWVVTAADTAVKISYSVVINDGTHPAGEGSYFEYEVTDISGNVLISHHDESNALPPGYQPGVSPNVFYIGWETDTLDLTPYIGTTVTLQFTAAGCIWSGHWSYAYVDCDPNFSNTIGIEEHNHQSLSVYPNPSAGGLYSVECIAGSNQEAPVVFDNSGRLVDALCTRTASGWNIDISDSAKGTYFAQIQTPEGVKHCFLIH